MNVNEILIRTINASVDARKRGFVNTANALDEIAESLLQLATPQCPSTKTQSKDLFDGDLYFH